MQQYLNEMKCWKLNGHLLFKRVSLRLFLVEKGLISSTCFYARRSQKRKKTVKSYVEKKLTNLLCCCTSSDSRFTLCAQACWNWPQVHCAQLVDEWASKKLPCLPLFRFQFKARDRLFILLRLHISLAKNTVKVSHNVHYQGFSLVSKKVSNLYIDIAFKVV